MGAAASANVRGRLEYIAYLEAEVQMLRAEKQEALRKVIVADSEKENIGHQSLRNRQTAGQAKANLVLATEQSAVNIAHLEAKVSEAVANEEHATLLLKELKADYELIKLELLASKIKADAEAKALLRIVNRLTAEKEYTVKTLVQKYDAIIEPLVRAPNPIREDFITFLGHIGELADGLKVKQIKSDIMAEIGNREAEAANYQRIPLSAYILPAKEFLLQDPDWAVALADITRGVEPEHWRETVAKAQVFFKDKLPTDIFNDALKAIENQTKRLEGGVADAVAESQQEVAEVTLTLNAAFDDIPEGSQQREDFKKNVLMDIAQSLGIPVDCLEITDLLPGSIIVKFKIKGDKASLPAQPSDLAANLLEQARQADSALMTGLVTSSTKGLETHAASPSHIRAAAAAAMFATPAKVVVPSPRQMLPAALSPRSIPASPSPDSPSTHAAAPAAAAAHLPPAAAASSENPLSSAAFGDNPPEIRQLTLADLHLGSGPAADALSSPQSAASSARSTASAKDKAAARAEKARMYKLQREHEENALRLVGAGASQAPPGASAAVVLEGSAQQPASGGVDSSQGAGNQYALPEDGRSLAVLDVLRRQKMAETTMAAFKGSNAEFYEEPVVDTVCDIHFKSDDSFDDSCEVGGGPTKDYLYHPQVLIVISYKDFVEERRDMRRYVWPDVTALVNDFGYAFRPIDPWIGCTSDLAAFSTDCMRDALDGTVSSQFWVFLFGSTYGYVPPLGVMSACSKKFPWYDTFRSERPYHPSWHEVVWMRNIFPDIELVKRRVMHYFRDVNYGETFTPEIREHFREAVADRLDLVQRLKDSVVETSLPLSTDYASPESGVRQLKESVLRMMKEFHKQESDQAIDNRRQMNSQMAAMSCIASEWFRHAHVVQKLLDFIDVRNPTTVPLCVCAPAGGGKTSLIARFRRDFRSASSKAFFITYFVSATTEARNVDRMCMFIVRSLKERFKFDDELPGVLNGISDWCSILRTWLGMAACKGRVVVLIDGVDQLDDRPGARSCAWLPCTFPLETRVVLTCAPGISRDVMMERSYDVFNFDIFEDAGGIKDTIKFHLQCRNRRLNEEIRLALGAKVQSIQASPFFLTVLLEEILMMQDQNRNPDLAISDYLSCLQANTLESLLEYVTWKWEGVFDKYSQGTCRGILTLLAASRWGLSEWEMLECMPHLSRVALLHFFNSTSYFWHWHNGYVNFKHGALRIAVESRFMPTRQERQAIHVKLARYFGSLAISRRRLEEQPWQLYKAEMWQELMNILSDMDMFKRLSNGVDMWRYDIRDFYHASNLHLDAAAVLLRGVNKFRETSPPVDDLIETSRLLAEFLTRQGKIAESIDIFHALLSQGQHKINEEIALIPSRFSIKVMDMAVYPKAEVGLQEQLRLEKIVVDVKESLSKLQGERWKQGVREFSVLNEGRDMMEDVVESRKKHVAVVQRIIEHRAVRQAESKMSESPMERLHREALEKQLRGCRIDLNFSRGKLASLCVLQGDYSVSFELFDVAMQEFTELFQSNHFSVSDMAAGLAELFLHRRDYSKAENFARKLVMIRHICYGWHHPEFAKGLELLSTVLRSRGNEFDADVMMRRAASIMMAFGLDSSKKESEEKWNEVISATRIDADCFQPSAGLDSDQLNS